MGTRSSEGALRAATATLLGNGGFAVQLRMPGSAVSGSDSEELGLGTPQPQDLEIWPAAWRKTGQVKEILLPAEAVNRLTGDQKITAAQQLFASAVGISAGGVLYRITDCVPLMAAGEAIAYRVELAEPAWA